MLIREEPATELVVATRILARAERLAADGRGTLRAGEVVYVAEARAAGALVGAFPPGAILGRG